MKPFAVVAVLLTALLPIPALAAEWGTIVPGESTTASVRARYGEPTQQNAFKVEGYDVTEWVYEGARAPGGIRRLSIEFGLLAPGGFQPDVVRLFRLEPMPGVFTRQTVVLGWGRPSRVGAEQDGQIFFYQDGLLVEFDAEGWVARSMTFMPRQPD